jgi:hypothetical protein
MTTHHETGQDAASSEGTVTVTETGSGTYTQQITAGHHRLVADEPRPIGDDAGPTPYDLLLAGNLKLLPGLQSAISARAGVARLSSRICACEKVPRS